MGWQAPLSDAVGKGRDRVDVHQAQGETNALAPVYLALLQSTVEDAIAFGARRLSLGRTALEPKAKMGCKPEALACAVRHRVSALNLLVSALTRTAAHDEPPPRNPFKAFP
jgi:hypothetical protein